MIATTVVAKCVRRCQGEATEGTEGAAVFCSVRNMPKKSIGGEWGYSLIFLPYIHISVA